MFPRLCGSSFVVPAVISSCFSIGGLQKGLWGCWSVDREGEKSYPVLYHLRICPLSPPPGRLKHRRWSHIGTRVSLIMSACERAHSCVKACFLCPQCVPFGLPASTCAPGHLTVSVKQPCAPKTWPEWQLPDLSRAPSVPLAVGAPAAAGSAPPRQVGPSLP